MKKNLLFIFSDQHRAMDLGCYGNEQVISPNLDRLSDDSVRFSNCISNTPLCVPARGSMLTGLMPIKHRAATNDLPINKNLKSVAHVLNDNGYHTGYIGKWHLAGVPRDQSIPKGKGRLGFTEWKVCNCNHEYMDAYYYDEDDKYHKIDGYEPIKQADMAIDFIQRNKDHPWGLYLSLGPPHDPYDQVPKEYLDAYKDTPIKLRENVKDYAVYTTEEVLDRDGVRETYKQYYAHVTAIDEQIGRIIKELEKTDQMDSTIIVYTSDHGDMLGSHGVMNKQAVYNEAVKVPLIVYSKNQIRQHICNELIGLVDLPISLMKLMGFTFPNETDGVDLSELFIDENAKGLNECYVAEYFAAHQLEWREGVEWRGIVTQKYSFCKTIKGDIELYDNETDKYQTNNLAGNMEYTEVIKKMNEILEAYIEKHDKMLPRDELADFFGLRDVWEASETYFDKVFRSGKLR